MKIAIGSDHRGFELKRYILEHMPTCEFIDVGSFSHERVDYPIYVQLVCDLILKKEASVGILLCATGVGMSIAANRFKHIYGALAWNTVIAQAAKEDDNANILIIPSEHVNEQEVIPMINIWLNSTFKQGRYLERVELLDTF